jgi:hypothetical protein
MNTIFTHSVDAQNRLIQSASVLDDEDKWPLGPHDLGGAKPGLT